MLGLTVTDRQTLPKFLQTARALPHLHWADVALSIGVIVIVLAGRLISQKAPGALIAIIIAIVVSRAADLAAHGVAVLGQVPRGLPHLEAPALGRHDAAVLLGTALAMSVVILAQSAVTARTYAATHGEDVRPERRPGRPGRRQRGGRVLGHVRRQRQPDPDPGDRQRGRPQPAGLAHRRRRWC